MNLMILSLDVSEFNINDYNDAGHLKLSVIEESSALVVHSNSYIIAN